MPTLQGLLLLDELAEALVHRFFDVTEGVRPAVVLQLQRGLAGEGIGHVFTDFFLRIRDLLDAKGEE